MELVQTMGNFAIKAEKPAFDFSESKWTVERQKNADAIAEQFAKNPNRVEVLSDSKFGTEPLVMLKKSKFEGFIKLFRDLNNGQAVVKHNLETISSAIAIIDSRIHEKKINDTQIIESLKILMSVSSQIKTEILISGKKKGIDLSQATDEEMSGLPKD